MTGTQSFRSWAARTSHYDGLNRRISKVDKTGQSDVTYDYYYNTGWQILEIRKDSDTDPYDQYVWGIRYVHSPVCRFRDGNTDGDYDDTGDDTDDNLYFANDANFNITALIETDGTVAERYVYDPYGHVTIYNSDWSGTVSWANSRKNPILYTGHRWDNETGLYYGCNRYYHPTLGRWLQRDPIGYVDGMNLYEYVRSKPVNLVDSYGRDSRTPEQKALDKEIEKNARSHSRKAYEWQRVAEKAATELNQKYSGPAVDWRAKIHTPEFKIEKHALEKVEKHISKADVYWYDKRHSCGPNITKQLKRAVMNMKKEFNNATTGKKCNMCYAVFNYNSDVLEYAWDINPLYRISPGKRGEDFKPQHLLRARGWGRSVQVGDRCYDAAAVNYVMWGTMGRLCKGYEGIEEWDDIWGRVRRWKKWSYGHSPSTETRDWAYAGWNGWPNSSIPRSKSPYPCRNLAWNNVHPNISWMPKAYTWLHDGPYPE